jgi:hypothetical protein
MAQIAGMAKNHSDSILSGYSAHQALPGGDVDVTETLFVFDKRNYLDCQKAFRGVRNQEYYLGDYSIEAGSVIDVRADKKAIGAISIIRLTSKTRLFFTRSWSHIREDATDVTVLWFVKRGRLCISHQRGHTVANAGDFAISKSMTPFSIECQTDDSSTHEVLHVIVPTHVLRRFVPQDVSTGFCVSAEAREFAIAERMLTDIFEDAGELADHIAQILIDSALLVLSDAIKGRSNGAPSRQSLSDKRLQDVLRFIEIHLSDPKLSIAMVAKGCGISTRYPAWCGKSACRSPASGCLRPSPIRRPSAKSHTRSASRARPISVACSSAPSTSVRASTGPRARRLYSRSRGR